MENNLTLLQSYGFAVDAEKPLSMFRVDGSPAQEIVLDDKRSQVSATIVQTAVKAGKALDMLVCVELANLKRAGAHNGKYDSFGRFAEALTGWNKDTVNSYTDCGMTFCNESGQPLKPFVSIVPVGALVQLKGLIKANEYVYGASVNLDFIEAILARESYSLSVSAMRELVKLLKAGKLPDKYITLDADGNATLCESEIKLTLPASFGAEDKPAENKPADGKDKGKDKPAENKPADPLEMLSDALAEMRKLTLPAELVKRLEILEASALTLCVDIRKLSENKPAEDKPAEDKPAKSKNK